jgi:hypothetical protein
VDVEDLEMRGNFNNYVDLTGTGSMEVIGQISLPGNVRQDGTTITTNTSSSSQLPSDIKLPQKPSEWVIPTNQPTRGEPEFVNVDNPGDWDRYIFKPTFEGRARTTKYKFHQLPTGARPVPKNDNGLREEKGWSFHYKGWKAENKSYRRGATMSDMFPKEMDGCLDRDVLKSLGLNKERITEADALFFYQLILPICDPSKSNVDRDPRMSYYIECEKFTNMGKAESGYGGSYGHSWRPTTASELVHFDGILIMNGVLGGNGGDLFRRWDEQSSCYNETIANTMTHTRFKELKASLKLCHNGSAPKKNQPGYDPSYKYDLIYKAMVHNTNAVTLYADENQTMDETTWGHGGFGEGGSGILGRLRNKKVNKGGQTVIVSDSRKYFRPRAYQHRHKLHKMPVGTGVTLTRQGCRELHDIAVELLKMVIGNDTSTRRTTDNKYKKIFRMKPCITVDNYFIDDAILNWIGSTGLGCIGTNARNVLPKEIRTEHLCVKKTESSNVTKFARFADPIVAVKDYDTYQRVHVSFQSTSSCNIATVNALNECRLFVEIRERGRKSFKRYWGIEMNNARRLYLSTYGMIDRADHLLKNASIYYRAWK